MSANTPEAVEACHELIVWLVPLLDHFPRSRRFTLGQRLEGGLLEVLEGLVEAAYSRRPGDPLRVANRKLQVVRHVWRACHELGVIPARRYEPGAERMVSIGRQIGGWQRSRAHD